MKKSLILLNLFFIQAFSLDINITAKDFINSPTTYISAQCYTKTTDEKNPKIVSNPCYSCHT